MYVCLCVCVCSCFARIGGGGRVFVLSGFILFFPFCVFVSSVLWFFLEHEICITGMDLFF